MTDKLKPHAVVERNAALIRSWFDERGGINVWSCADLSRAGHTFTAPARDPKGNPDPKPHWSAGEIIRRITDPAEVVVSIPREVKRFRVAVRLGSQGLALKLTDNSVRKLRAALAHASERFADEAWYEFDYETQEAVIYVSEKDLPLPEWKPEAKAS